MAEPNPPVRVSDEGVVQIWDSELQSWVDLKRVTPTRTFRKKDWREEA